MKHDKGWMSMRDIDDVPSKWEFIQMILVVGGVFISLWASYVLLWLLVP